MRNLSRIALAGATALVCLAGVQANEPEEESTAAEPHEQAREEDAESHTGQAGLIAVRDESGNLRPATPEEARQLLPAGLRAARAPIASLGPHGSRRLVVAPAYLEFLAVERAADGTLTFGHVEIDQAVEGLASQPHGGPNDR